MHEKFKLIHGPCKSLIIVDGQLGLPPDFQGYFNFFSVSEQFWWETWTSVSIYQGAGWC